MTIVTVPYSTLESAATGYGQGIIISICLCLIIKIVLSKYEGIVIALKQHSEMFCFVHIVACKQLHCSQNHTQNTDTNRHTGRYTHAHTPLPIIHSITKAWCINDSQPQLNSSLLNIHSERINVNRLHNAVYSQEKTNTNCKSHQTCKRK